MKKQLLHEVCVGPLSFELGPSTSLLHARWQRELDLRVVHLLDNRSSGLGCSYRFHPDDLDGVCASTVTSSHIAIALRDGGRNGHVTVLPVHVVGARARVVTQPDAEVLDLQRLLLFDLLYADDLSGSLLKLTELTQEVPKPENGQSSIYQGAWMILQN